MLTESVESRRKRKIEEIKKQIGVLDNIIEDREQRLSNNFVIKCIQNDYREAIDSCKQEKAMLEEVLQIWKAL